ncbi:glycosyltransferase [Leptolyngbya ohadii]|uniref:glycosyltransferase n=1 Tax=Leptolyngbya ohadii TaxID=1962290 RepID=UPI000B598572|nr:hypothetical protein [Leptolyngbya ohadii]
MARFLLGTIPIIGHVSPAIPIVRELVKRGYQVCWYTGRAFQAAIEAIGARFVPICSWTDYSDLSNISPALMQQRETLQGAKQLKFDLKNFFIEPAQGQTKDLADILDDFPVDILLADSMFLGIS